LPLVAGAGMAGLVAAARLRELGVDAVVHEKGTRVGGSMLLSSCVVFRHRTLELFREECPDGDPELQRLIVERLDDALGWLEWLGAEVVWQETGNPLTVGKRFEPRSLVEALLRRARVHVQLGSRLPEGADGPVILATGGFPLRLARERGLLVRSNPWSEGDGFDFGRARGAAAVGDLGEFYGRALPAPPAHVPEERFVELTQLYGRFAEAVDERGEPFFDGEPRWHENDLVQAIARLPERAAWYRLDEEALRRSVRERTVADMVDAARAAGGEVRQLGDGRVAVHVAPGVTHTLGGLRVDTSARVLDESGAPVADLYAAGVDAGGVAGGGYASGLAQALVLGLAAAESAADAK
jgi:fumarate reductase flavoprotein subunit